MTDLIWPSTTEDPIRFVCPNVNSAIVQTTIDTSFSFTAISTFSSSGENVCRKVLVNEIIDDLSGITDPQREACRTDIIAYGNELAMVDGITVDDMCTE